jgi:hypothetical protein
MTNSNNTTPSGGNFTLPTAVRNRMESIMSANELFYGAVSVSTPLVERLAKGCNGDITPLSTGWVIKTSKLDDDTEIETEIEHYQKLDELGLCGVAVPDCNFTRSGDGQLVLQQINNAVTLAEYSQHPALTHTVWLDICLAAAYAVKKVHQAGFNHYDLHGNNVVLELVEDKWRAYVIDFALAEHYESNFLGLSWEDWQWEAQGDTQYLVDSLIAFYPDKLRKRPGWFDKVLEVFQGC